MFASIISLAILETRKDMRCLQFLGLVLSSSVLPVNIYSDGMSFGIFFVIYLGMYLFIYYLLPHNGMAFI